jgi:hypothetical protein
LSTVVRRDYGIVAGMNKLSEPYKGSARFFVGPGNALDTDAEPTTGDILDKAGLPASIPTADGRVTREMMVIAHASFVVTNSGLTSLELSGILGLQNPGHEDRVWRPGSDRRVNRLLLAFKKKGLIEYRKGAHGVFRWFPKEVK